MTETDALLQLLGQVADSLQELVRLMRVVSYSTVKQLLETTLDTEEKRSVYHLLDGTRSVVYIQELTGVNVRYISEWGQEWEKLGIVELSTVSRVRGRRQRSFDLAMFGIPVPEVGADEADR
jgi:Cdc6-like AAA superfamily ATPase